MTQRFVLAFAVSLVMITTLAPAHAADICGNGLDDDGDNLADEGCYSSLTTGVCESPLSCSDTGMVSPVMGSLRYQLPPDVAPKVPFGVGIGLRRFYTSMYSPGSGAPVWRKPMGDRWQHTYMTWLTQAGSPPTSKIVLHTNRGQDILATYNNVTNGCDTYSPQAGFHVQYLRKCGTQFELRMLTGETLIYNSTGRLIEIWDTVAAPNTNKVLVAYDGAGQVSTVTDASGKRRLLFAYASSLLTSVQFQILSASWTTHHTTSYAYTSGRMTAVTIGGSLAQTNVYTSSYLTQIQDATGKSLVTIAYNATAGKVARIDTPQGMIGFEYNSSRATCLGKTVLHFNRGNTLSCNSDSSCGAGYLCGGTTGGGSTGVCFRAARCLTVASPSEDVVTAVAAMGPPSETCTGACLEATQYVWNTGTGVLDLAAIQDASGNYTVRAFNSNGLPTTISYGDPDTNPSNSNGARQEFLSYDALFPGKVKEVWRQSDLVVSPACVAGTSGNAGCARTIRTYNVNGKLQTIEQAGYTLNADNSAAAFSYITTMSYDTRGRPTQIDGPLAGTNDVTMFEYWAPTGALSDDLLKDYRRKKDASAFLDQRALTYDFWGNPTSLLDADGTVSCVTFDSARGYLKKHTETMAGQTDCTANSADLVTQWTRDSALRLVQLTRPDGSCMFFEYDNKGRLQRTKRRDDCNASSAGDRQEFVYDAEGLLTEIQIYDAASTLTSKQPFTYFDSRRLEKIVNPVDTSKWTGVVYDPRGLVSQIDAAGSLGKTVFNRSTTPGSPGSEGRVTSVDKYKTSTTFDTWSLLYDWNGDQTQVTDGDSKATVTQRDDLGRVVKLTSPDISQPVKRTYDAASRLVTMVERYGGGTDQRVHSFTFDNLGRPLASDYATGHSAGTCNGTTNPPEIERVYDAAPVSCPIAIGCTRTEGRPAYVRTRLMCSSGLGTDSSLDQETFYAYDDAGRILREYIRDDSGRVAENQFTWTKNGELTQMVTPASIALGWTFGSAANNSDTDLVTAQSRNGTANPITSNVSWTPYGPLKQYDQHNTIGGVGVRTRISRNLAYRIADIFVETQTGGTTLHALKITEDVKGRVTAREYTSMQAGVQNSYFRYDDQDRVLCETTTFAAGCPTSGSTIKNSHIETPPFTNAGDWKRLLRPIPGSTGLTHVFNEFGYGTSHRITRVTQNDGTPALGNTFFSYHADGDRSGEDSSTQPNSTREFFYDSRHNLIQVTGYYRNAGTWDVYFETSTFDAQNRRVSKSFRNARTGATASWFFYYGPFDQLTEVRYTPSTATPATYQVFQLLWLGDRLTGIWQLDFPSVTLSKRYVSTDETNRPLEMWAWPPTGNTTQVWAVNPTAWGFDKTLLGSAVFQPVLFAGQYQDSETAAYLNDGSTTHRPGLALNGFRTYDPFTGAYLQVDPLAPVSLSSYVYAESDPVGKSDRFGLDTWLDSGPGGVYVCHDVPNPSATEAQCDKITMPGSAGLGLDPWHGGWWTPPPPSGGGGGGFNPILSDPPILPPDTPPPHPPRCLAGDICNQMDPDALAAENREKQRDECQSCQDACAGGALTDCVTTWMPGRRPISTCAILDSPEYSEYCVQRCWNSSVCQ